MEAEKLRLSTELGVRVFEGAGGHASRLMKIPYGGKDLVKASLEEEECGCFGIDYVNSKNRNIKQR